MADSAFGALGQHIERGLALNESSDPRIGSSRENSTSSGTLSNATKGTNSASFAALFSTLIPVAVYAVVCVLIFWVLRARYPRVYSPRTFLSSLEPHERSEKLPSGWFNWLKPLLKVPDSEVLNKSSIDGFLFLRFLKVLCVICLVGACITWPVLFPIHILGGAGKKELDALTFGNVSRPSWYFVHAFLAWIFFGFIMYMVCRESVYYINLRQAYLLSPYYAKRLSSRTVLFTCVPEQYRDAATLRKVFGDAVKNVWIPRYGSELDDLVKERDQTALRLEDAEIELISMANVARNKTAKNSHTDIEANVQGSEAGDSNAKATTTISHESTAIESISSSTTSPVHEPVDIETTVSRRDTGGSSKDAASTVHALECGTLELNSPQKTSKEAASTIPAIECGTLELDSPQKTSKEAASTIPAIECGTLELNSPQTTSKEAASTVHALECGTLELNSPQKSWWQPALNWDINGSVAAQWIPTKERPSHRPLANYGRKVDTIKWTRNRLKVLAPKISQLRKKQRGGKAAPMPAAFVEFDSLTNAQSAYQTLAHHRAFHMTPHINGIRPEEIVWSTLRMKWWERIIRKFLTTALVAVMIIFWSIPAAFTGIISNIDFLSSFVFLSWIDKLPSFILGLLKGLLPAIALSLLMDAVPHMLRRIAQQAGVPTLAMVELFVQSSYFIFQVVQVFLVTTLTSAVSGAIGEIINDPMSAQVLLSENLPTSSNFYVSYLILQGLAMSATRVVHLPTLQMVLSSPLKSPRRISIRWHRLRRVYWGSVFPLFTNMGVIAISYSCIAPIILGFAGMCFYIVYRVYHYNLLYVYSSEIDTRGLLYPHALKQILTGVYLAEVCLIGLFGLRGAFGPFIMMIMLVIFTFLVNLSLNDALGPLLYNLPRTLAVQELYANLPANDGHLAEREPDLEVAEEANGYDSDFDPGAPRSGAHEKETARGVEGAEGLSKVTFHYLFTSITSKFSSVASPVTAWLHKVDFWTRWISPDPAAPKPGFLIKWLHPEIYDDYNALRKMVAEDLPDAEYPPGALGDAYFPPGVSELNDPMLWIPEDAAGVSRQELDHTGKVIQITDKACWLEMGKKGKPMVRIDMDVDSPVLKKRIRY